MAASSVAFWPVGNGDVIESGKAVATLILRDHSRITVLAGSRVKIDNAGDFVNVRVLSGAVDYNLISPASARLFLGDRNISNSGTQGTVGKSVPPGNTGRRGDPNGSGNSQPILPPPSVSPVI
jgi:hypothetical protein